MALKEEKREQKKPTKINTNGLPVKNRPGFPANSAKLCFRLWRSVFRPLAFSMIPLSSMVMTGATRIPAAPAAMASTPTLRPSFAVFHGCWWGLRVVVGGIMSFGRSIV